MDTISPVNAVPALRVLFIEDSASEAELVSLELLNQGYVAKITRVDTPRALADALDHGPWDVVLWDHRSPQLDALSSLAAVQQRGIDVPFIIVSDRISESSAVEVMRAGAHDFLSKNSLARLGAVIERETCEAEVRQERRRMQQQLLLADRLSSLGMLAAGIAHEINNPLAYVLGNLEFALEHLATGHQAESAAFTEVRQALEQAREGSARIGRLTRDLKVFCRSDAEVTSGPVNVRRVMESSMSIAWNQIRHRARLTRHFERVPVVTGDEHRLGQVFLNLLVNAAQAFEHDDIAQNEIVVSIKVVDERVLIEVEDNGRGMSPDEQARLFEPFFTTKAPGAGTGIGLSISRSIVSDMGGSISCDSRKGAGTTFRVQLPAQEALVRSTRPPRPERPELPTTRVLVVDDEPALSAVVRRLLRGEHEVLGFTNAREALDLLQQDAEFDVIICDVMMPNMSGIEFYEALCLRRPRLAARTVFMTGGVFHAAAREFLSRVAHPVLEKPFETQALHEAIAQVLETCAVSGTWLTAEADVEQAV